MKKIVEFFKNMSTRTRLSAEELYYSESKDLVDLERRMRQVQKGEAPFQKPFYG